MFQDDVLEVVVTKAKMDIRLLRATMRRFYWKKLCRLVVVNKQWMRVVGRESAEELEVRFKDVPSRAKRIIFEKVREMIRPIEGEYRDGGDEVACKRFVACKIVSKQWKYWITKVVDSVELRVGFIDVAMDL